MGKFVKFPSGPEIVGIVLIIIGTGLAVKMLPASWKAKLS